MMHKYIIIIAIWLAGFVENSQAASYSQSCVWKNGQQVCTSQNDPNGNMAAGVAGINGDQGVVAAGAGSPDNFNTDYQQTGFGGQSNADGFGTQNGGYSPSFGYGGQNDGVGFGSQNGGSVPNSGYGANGIAVGSSSGYPPNFGPNFPQWNGDPFTFVQDFMRNRGKR